MAMDPKLRPITIMAASIRTAHLLIGTGLLATAVALAVRVWRRGPMENSETSKGLLQ